MPVAEIGTEDVLRPVWGRAPETASRVRQRIEAVLDAARVKGWRAGENPARWKGHLAGELPPPRKVKRVRHRPALPWQRMGEFMAALARREGMAPLALRFAILTAARSGEVRGMRWSEVDLDVAVWTVPGERMKGGRTHRVPLSPAALAVLEAVRPLAREPQSLVFPGGKAGQPLSDMAISEVVRRMNEGGAGGEPPRCRAPATSSGAAGCVHIPWPAAGGGPAPRRRARGTGRPRGAAPRTGRRACRPGRGCGARRRSSGSPGARRPQRPRPRRGRRPRPRRSGTALPRRSRCRIVAAGPPARRTRTRITLAPAARFRKGARFLAACRTQREGQGSLALRQPSRRERRAAA
jgi:hypothetical protein